MRSKIALAALALAAFASAPTLAQYGPPQSPGIGPHGDARYGVYNEAPYYEGGYLGGPQGYNSAPGYYDYSSGGYFGGAPGYNSAPAYRLQRNSTNQRRRGVYNYSRQRTAPTARAAGAGTAPAEGAGAVKQPMGRP